MPNIPASQLIGELAAGFADRLDEQMDEGEQPLAALCCVWTTKGVRHRIGTSGRYPTREDTLKLLAELRQAVRETETKEAGRIG